MTSRGGCPRFAYVVLQRIRLSWVSEGKDKSMKTNRFLLLLYAMLSFVYCVAQNPIEVQRFKQWGHEYLTVTNTWNGIFATPIDGEIPPLLSVITEVMGESTKGMTVEKFQETLHRNQQVPLKYLQKINGQIVNKSCTIAPKSNYYLAEGIETTAPLAKPSSINISSDGDIDFFNFCTYDFKVEGDDPLTDKAILEQISLVFDGRGMKRDTSNPDLLFTMSKMLQQTTNSVYVPETRQVVNTGSTTSLQRNIFTGKNYLATQQHNTVVKSGGYTHTNVSATFHLVLTIMDGKKLRQDPSSLPVVWKLDYNEFSSSAIDIMSTVSNGVSYWCLNYPFAQPKFSYSTKTVGVAFRSQEDVRTGEIIDVLQGTDAWNKGLRPGYKIKMAYTKGWYAIAGCTGKSKYFVADSYKETNIDVKVLWFYVPFFVIPHNTTNHPYDYLTLSKRDGSVGFGMRYKVQDDFGGIFKIKKGPFKKSEYNYEYIY